MIASCDYHAQADAAQNTLYISSPEGTDHVIGFEKGKHSVPDSSSVSSLDPFSSKLMFEHLRFTDTFSRS